MRLFFKHDLYARNDTKLLRLRMTHGLEGIGAYWCLVEMMYEQGGKILLEDLDIILFQTQISEELVKSMTEIGLFDNNGACLTCPRIIEAIEDRESIREKRRDAVNKRWHKADTNVLQMNSDADTSVIQRREDNREDEDKEKNSLQSSQRKSAEADPTAAGKEEKADAPDFRKLADFFNDELRRNGSIIPTIRSIDGQRRSSTMARIREHGKPAFAEAVKKAAESDFLNGKNDRGWVADFDWMIKPNNFIKVLEGNYDNRQQNNQRYGNTGKHNQRGKGGNPEDGYESSL